jgi:ABC-2 type transport system ATP-binding protein
VTAADPVAGPLAHPAAGRAIEVAGLRMSYGDLVAADGLDFAVASGEFFGILGPNGAGKTTTLEMVEGLRRPDAGEVRLLGSPTPGSSGSAR